MANGGMLDRAGDFVWRNARLLERRLLARLFLGGPAEPVLAALRPYQNDDGGFGHALEPDKRCPDSQPIDAETALRVMDDAGALDGEMVRRLCDFLLTISTPEGGVPFVLPSVRGYPRAPWWETDDDPPAALNPTAAIAGLLHRHGVAHRWLDGATAYCWRAIDASPLDEPHEVLSVITFLEHAPDRARAEHAFARVAERLRSGALVALDPATPGYVKMPLDYAPAPNSLCRPVFADDVIAAHLDALAARQQPDGGWPIAWPAVGPGAELEWRGMMTIAALKTLRAYGRLP